MPCVCLVNTFACWKSYRAQKLAVRKADWTATQKSVARKLIALVTAQWSAAQKQASVVSESVKTAQAELLQDGAVVKVPHTRKKLATVSQAVPQSASGVSAVLTVKPSRKLRLTRLARKSEPAKPTEKDHPAKLTQKTNLAQPTRKTRLAQLVRKTRPSKPMPWANDAPIIDYDHPPVHLTRADLINAESRLGSTIFGPIPAGHRREFFHDRNNVWIWHEDWSDGQNNPHQMTVRYEVRTTGVYKKVAQGKYLKLEGDELENFRKATHAYLYVIKKNLYQRLNMHQTA